MELAPQSLGGLASARPALKKPPLWGQGLAKLWLFGERKQAPAQRPPKQLTLHQSGTK